MNTYTRVYLTCLFLYSLVVEVAIYIGVHHVTVDPFLEVNGMIILVGGGVAVFVGGIAGLMEFFWD